MSARVLVTGFRKFGGLGSNPSEEIVLRLAAAPPAGVAIETLVLPVEYGAAFAPVREALDSRRFAAVVHLGVAAGRSSVEVERVALNWRGARQPDEAGVLVEGERIEPRGPAAAESTLPVAALADAVAASGVPAQVSHHAGTFLCNQVLFQTLRHVRRAKLGVRAAFIHVPLPGPEDGRPDLDALTAGVAAALRAAAEAAGARSVRTRRATRR